MTTRFAGGYSTAELTLQAKIVYRPLPCCFCKKTASAKKQKMVAQALFFRLFSFKEISRSFGIDNTDQALRDQLTSGESFCVGELVLDNDHILQGGFSPCFIHITSVSSSMDKELFVNDKLLSPDMLIKAPEKLGWRLNLIYCLSRVLTSSVA